MKTTIQLFGILCIALLTASAATAETLNKDLPAQEELTNFISTIPPGDNFTVRASELSVKEHPAWKWDIWASNNNSTLISFYYVDDTTKKGYGSLYYNNCGIDYTKKLRGVHNTLLMKYLGEDTKENYSVPVMNVSDENNSVTCLVENLTENVTAEIVNNSSVTEAIKETASPVVVTIKNETGTINSMGDDNTNTQFFIEIKDSVINFINNNLGGRYTP